ncbi:MAG: hypothetical protein DWQ44_01700 [Bacteroidetes bacterium]|nr:MAG: hypothetical protein DWQ33_05430 [Bacteroidota bacterium]REK04693.1 MAG: hypothetical protein DWQ39_05590 [Bacteroidota bacterium]REK36168.1 MAG: hypothetical protein DWQ44_01700 [Bacteroidota bacterium]REK51461.1 MAG: hypothetical protein DWQ48_01135 [Bacteroidota bacterium]
METALVGYAMPIVIKKLKALLDRLGFVVVGSKDKLPELQAFQNGNWFRSSRNIIFRFSKVEDNLTRIDITATIENNKNNRRAEEVIEEKIVSTIYQHFTTTRKLEYGI